MQPLMCSVAESEIEGKAVWKRAGSNIKYYRNNFFIKTQRKALFSATFTIQFPCSNDTCYIAYHYPYSYSRLLVDISKWQQQADKRPDVFFSVQTLTKTLLGNSVPILTVTSASSDNQDRQYAVLSARVHPGESNSSWVMKGLINRLLDSSTESELLRQKFIFKIVPMINPDGVIVGNHRTSLSAKDLNRQWINPDENAHPEIHSFKNIFYVLQKVGITPYIFIDFHGHSCQKDLFLYGCLPSKSWMAPYDYDNPSAYSSKSNFPSAGSLDNLWKPSTHEGLMADFSNIFKSDTAHKDVWENRICLQLSQILSASLPAFSEAACSYAVQKTKESTARVVVWRQFGVLRSYTMESSYCGVLKNCYDDLSDEGHQISTKLLETAGARVLDAFLVLLQRRGEKNDYSSFDSSQREENYESDRDSMLS
ncbi:Cytosolic carboxypeptidase 4 [Cichlidogyrus casuarinus]|uniref:Cytosolic carboxypeptidase 4 n=1 Tax=Cichlidogyrus casuarinus TaxID=1844966 RepID=A0ABD2PV71_9PLAT